MLCPNCHSQTETYAARNRRRTSPRQIATSPTLSKPRAAMQSRRRSARAARGRPPILIPRTLQNWRLWGKG
jgi:hypothetical protein